MAVAEGRLRFKVYLDEGQRVAEIFVTPATKCRDIVQRLQRQIHEPDCFLVEVWQGCERLVPDNELILSTLLEWGSDLDDVKFYLHPREDTPSYSQVVNGPSPSQRVNGFKEEPPLSRDVLLGGSRISVNDLKEFAARQQQEIAAKEKELKARQVQLMEMKRKSQNKPQNPYIQQLSAKADEQDKRLKELRHVQDQVDSYKLSNSALAEELENVRSLFMEKEKELAIAVAKVETLTQQLDKQRKGWSQSSPSREKTHQELELERLRKELMTRNELNHQQSVQIQSQKQLLAEKHKELFELDAQIDRYTNDLRQKRSQNNHIDPPNHRLNGAASPTDEQNFVDMDYSNFGSFPEQPNKTNRADSDSTESVPVTSGSFRGRARNGRKLETLLEVEEEVSDGHASSKSSTEDLTQGPGPPRLSRVTALKSRFEAEGAKEGGKRWTSHNTESRVNKDVASSAKLSNVSSTPAHRVAPEGVETPPSPAREMFDLDAVHSVDEERGKRSYGRNEFLNISSLKIKSPGQDAVKNMETRNLTVQEDAFEVPHSLEIKNILGELDLKSEEPSCSTQSSTPSDGGDFSGPSSPSSLSSSSSISSNSTSPKTAVFAITGVAKKSNSFPRHLDPPQQRSAETRGKASPSVGLQGLKTAQHQHGLHRPSSNTKDLEPLSAKPERPSSGVLTSERSTEDFPLQARLVKSEAIPTKNENVGSIARTTVLDFSRSRTTPKRFGETNTKQNEANISSDRQKVSRLTEAKALDTKPERVSVTASKASDESSTSDGKQVSNVVGIRVTDSSVKTGKVQLSRLRYAAPAPLNNATPQQEAMFNSESQTRLERKVEDPAPNTNKKERFEDTKKLVDSSLETSKRALTNAPLPWFAQNSDRAPNFKSSNAESKVDDKSKYASNIDETDKAKSLSDEKSSGTATVNPPLIFKPISFRAKKLAVEQSNMNTSDNRSQVAPPISNSISIRGQSSSLTKITVTPAASFYSAKNSANIPEKRSPVPTSKRQRFIHRDMAPTYPELLTNDESGNDALLDQQQYEKYVDKENLDQETTLTSREQGNKPRKMPRPDAKQVVSSFNIQLSSQSRKQTQEQEAISPSSEQSSGSYTSEEKRDGVPSESKRLHYDSGRLSSESGRYNNENSENVAGGDFRKSQLEREPLSKNVFTSSLLKPLPPPKQISTPQKAEETFRLNNAAQKLTGSSNDELLQSELSSTGTRPSNNKDDILSDGMPAKDNFQQNMVTKAMVTIKNFPLRVTDVDTGIPVAVNENIGLTSQSHNPISDQSSIAIKNLPVTAKSDHKAKPVIVNGNVEMFNHSHRNFSKESIASGESRAEVAQVPAQNDRKKKARHVSLDPHAVLLDAAVEGELDLVKHVIREVDNPSKPNTDGITALHNAVCASHDEVVHFLVEYGADINSPDSHGWTPLHCAAANNATEMARFLIEHGACIFVATSLEKKTPLQCCERGLPGYFNCMKYLNDVQENFGLVNEGRVYALYNYSANEQDELSFECGEELLVLKRGDATEKEWWWAQNNNGETGYIPRNLLGLTARISLEVP